MTCHEAFRDLQASLLPTYGEGEAKSICRIVFEDVFGFFQGPDRHMEPAEVITFKKIKSRLLNGEPIQYILGEADFYGYKFAVNEDVLIPRQETEELVYWIRETVKASALPLKSVLDIGTGTGCIPITLGKLIPSLSISAVDVSDKALAVARGNADRLNVPIQLFNLDILKEQEWTRLSFFDIIVSNPPYIPRKERDLMDRHVVDFEPHLALFVDKDDPLLFYKKITLFALKHLGKNGYLFFETNAFNAKEVAAFIEKNGFSNVRIEKDMSGNDRMIRAQLL